MIYIIRVIIIIKTGSTGPCRKPKLLLVVSQPHKHLHLGKLKKTKFREATNSWLHPWTHPTFRYQTQCWKSNSMHNQTRTGRKHLANFDVLHLGTSNANRRAATAARVCRTLVDADGQSIYAILIIVDTAYMSFL